MATNKPTNANMRLDLESESFETGEAVTLEDGVHRGIISDVYAEQSRDKASGEVYKYLQLDIQPKENTDMTLRYGCPLPEGRPVTNQSKLGKLMLAFGFDISPGSKFNLKEVADSLKGREVVFQTVNKPNRSGTAQFANILDDTIKPVKK